MRRFLLAATFLVGAVPPCFGGIRAPGTPGEAGTYHSDLTAVPAVVRAGEPVELIFQAIDPGGNAIRFLELVHERPLHLMVVSEDLSYFDHIHPEQVLGTTYNVTHVFPHGGRYRLYASYTPPGSGTVVEQFCVEVLGPKRERVRLVPDADLTRVVDGLKVTLSFDGPVRAGADLPLQYAIVDAQTGAKVNDLQLYLGALAHIVVIDEDLETLLHVHPLEAGEVYDPSKDPAAHFHDPKEWAKQLVGPSPSEIHAVADFPKAGTYKMWLQLRRRDRMITVPFVLRVGRAERLARGRLAPIPADAIRVTVGSGGYAPARIEVERGKPVRLAFVRPEGNNCGGKVRFPSLNREYALPVGQVVLVELPPSEAGEIGFTCGMGMLQGVLVVK